MPSCCGCLDGLRLLTGLNRKTSDVSFLDCIDAEELQAMQNQEIRRDRVLTMLEDPALESQARRGERFYTAEEISELSYVTAFREDFMNSPKASRPSTARKNSLDNTAWGDMNTRGGEQNSWDSAEVGFYKVRGPSYIQDKKKVKSDGIPGAELVVVDFFEPSGDIAHISASSTAGTIDRIRRSGDNRQLFVLNFRVLPLQLVIVFAVPELNGSDNPALKLLHRFMSDDMTDQERSKRLKVVPRMIEGPWVTKMVVGQTPAILGKNIPLDYYKRPNDFDVSICISKSSAAQSIVSVLKPAAAAIAIELIFIIEGQAPDELPEDVLGGFRITHADLSSVRYVNASV